MKTLKEQRAKAWRLAPDDARWIAQDKNGDFWWYSYQPEMDDCLWDISMNLSDEEGKIGCFKINSWDWRDTLQTREEWEAMNKQDEKWMPEVGRECEVSLPTGHGEYEWVPCTFIGMHGDFYVYAVDGDGYGSTDISNLRPIQTQADKYREEQIEKIADCFNIAVGGTGQSKLDRAYIQGVRVLTPDELPAKRLTDNEVEFLILEYPSLNRISIRAVQNAMLGDEK